MKCARPFFSGQFKIALSCVCVCAWKAIVKEKKDYFYGTFNVLERLDVYVWAFQHLLFLYLMRSDLKEEEVETTTSRKAREDNMYWGKEMKAIYCR